VKELLGIGEGLSGRLLLYDALAAEFRKIKVPRDPNCPLCGNSPSITDF
jgi:molybdopterin-synthase adenylyltransferase